MRRQGLLSTGEFARLCHTTKETLYHYAELGLLRPCYVGANDYRYYDVQQYLIFDLICSFKDTKASLKEISALLQPLSGKTGLKDQAPAFEMSAFFKRHLEDVEKRLKNLNRQKELLKSLEAVARRGLEVPLNELLTEEECGLETRRAMALHSARCLEALTHREFFPPPPLGFVFSAEGLSQLRGGSLPRQDLRVSPRGYTPCHQERRWYMPDWGRGRSRCRRSRNSVSVTQSSVLTGKVRSWPSTCPPMP